MTKKQTKHAESRALKKEKENKRSFFSMPLRIYIHPFSDRSLERLLDKLLKIPPSDLPYNIETDWALLDKPKYLDFEEFLVLNSIMEGVSRLNLHIAYDSYEILRSFHWKEFMDDYEEYAPRIGFDLTEVKKQLVGARMGVWRRREFDFPDITLSISDIIRNSIAYWQSEIKTSGCSHPKGKSHFVNFLAILIRGMIFRPMNVPAKYKGGPITYEYVFGDDEAAKFRATFPKAIRYPVGNWNNPFQICRSINWSLAIVRLAKILQEGNYFKKVVLITETRPSQKVQVTLRDFCGSQGVPFVSRYFPHETIDLDLNEGSVYLIEYELLWKLYKYAKFGSSPIVPLKGIKKSRQQNWH